MNNKDNKNEKVIKTEILNSKHNSNKKNNNNSCNFF